MKYLEFYVPAKINNISTILLENYKLVEAKITSDELQTILQRLNTQLMKEFGSKPSPVTVRQVLSSHKINPKIINAILADIDVDNKSKTTQTTDTSPATTDTSPATSDTETTPEPSTDDRPSSSPLKSFEIKIPSEDAKKILRNLGNQYPGIDHTVEDQIRSLARSAMSGIDNNDPNLIYKAINSQLELVNAEIAKRQPKSESVYETSSSGGTSSGAIASVSAPLGAIIKRMPPGQSFFAPMPVKKTKKTARKKSKKR